MVRTQTIQKLKELAGHEQRKIIYDFQFEGRNYHVKAIRKSESDSEYYIDIYEVDPSKGALVHIFGDEKSSPPVVLLDPKEYHYVNQPLNQPNIYGHFANYDGNEFPIDISKCCEALRRTTNEHGSELSDLVLAHFDRICDVIMELPIQKAEESHLRRSDEKINYSNLIESIDKESKKSMNVDYKVALGLIKQGNLVGAELVLNELKYGMPERDYHKATSFLGMMYRWYFENKNLYTETKSTDRNDDRAVARLRTSI